MKAIDNRRGEADRVRSDEAAQARDAFWRGERDRRLAAQGLRVTPDASGAIEFVRPPARRQDTGVSDPVAQRR